MGLLMVEIKICLFSSGINILAVVSFVLVNPALFKVIRRGARVVLINMILNCVPTVLFLGGIY